jgi:hypothetical protein
VHVAVIALDRRLEAVEVAAAGIGLRRSLIALVPESVRRSM